MFDFEAPGLSIPLLVLVLIVVPCGIAVFFGMFAFKGMAPQLFHCARCGADFARKPWRGFPKKCPRCAAPDWNA